MKRREFLLYSLASIVLPWIGCNKPKMYLGKISELKNRESYFEFNGNKIFFSFMNEKPFILNLTCTHKKCTVQKKESSWLCPCHKGKFSWDGKKISGKPPRDLYQFQYEIIGDDIWILNQIVNP